MFFEDKYFLSGKNTNKHENMKRALKHKTFYILIEVYRIINNKMKICSLFVNNRHKFRFSKYFFSNQKQTESIYKFLSYLLHLQFFII